MFPRLAACRYLVKWVLLEVPCPPVSPELGNLFRMWSRTRPCKYKFAVATQNKILQIGIPK